MSETSSSIRGSPSISISTRSVVSLTWVTTASYPGSLLTTLEAGSARTFSATRATSSSWFSTSAAEMFLV